MLAGTGAGIAWASGFGHAAASISYLIVSLEGIVPDVVDRAAG